LQPCGLTHVPQWLFQLPLLPGGCWSAEPELLSAMQWPQAQGSFAEPGPLHAENLETC